MVTMSIDRQHSVQNTIRARALRQRRTDAIVSQLRVARPASPDSRDLTRQLIESNIDMARTVAKRYTGRGIELDDLEQVALLGLTKAARRFDPAAGHDFMAFAVPTIRGELRRYFRDLGWAVKPPRPVQEMQIRIARAQAELAQELQRSPRPTELARHLGEELELVVEALAADGCFTPASLDAQIGEHGTTVGALLGGPDRDLEVAEAKLLLDPVVARLSARDRRVLQMRFYEERSQQEIADEIGVSQAQVSRIVARILRALRAQLADKALTGTPPHAAVAGGSFEASPASSFDWAN